MVAITMKLSCLPVSLYPEIIGGRMSIVDWAHMGSALGLDAIDLSILFFPECIHKDVQALRREIESVGMQVAMFTTYTDFTHPDPNHRQQELKLAVQSIEIASELGARLIRATAGQAYLETRHREGVTWAIEGLRQFSHVARCFGIIPVYENHAKPMVWKYTDFSQSPETFLEIVSGTADTGLGINFDTANATAFSNQPIHLLDQILDRVVSIHASDTSRRGELQPTLIGSGLTPFDLIFDHLIQSGWDGWICIEEDSNNGKTGIDAAVHFIRQCWEKAEERFDIKSINALNPG
jgi:sugar phosphate isomerase/epimerase